MGRNRKNKNDKCLPPYVYRGRTHYEWRPPKGKKLGYEKLSPINSTISEVWQKWEELQQREIYNLAWLLSEYKNSPQFVMRGDKPKSKDTIEGQTRQIEFLINYKLKNGKSFGSANLEKITKGVMRNFLDKRLQDCSGVSGNREKTLISVAWKHALERDKITWSNPCEGVARNPERARDRYVTDQEYDIAYRLDGPGYIPIAMELAYLCRMRRGEILKATEDQITEEGFDTIRIKGSLDTITEWSDRLRAAIGAAKSLPSKIERIGGPKYLIHNKYGLPISLSAFKCAWTRRKVKMVENGIDPFNFHDLKAKGVSDFEGNKQEASGHKTASQVAIYDRKKHKVKPTR